MFDGGILGGLRGLLCLLCLLGLLGCSGGKSERERPIIACSIHPLGALVREIAGPHAEVIVLLSPGASPHAFEPSPRLVARGSEARLVVRIGAGLDDWARPIVADALGRGAPEIVAAALVDSLLPALPDQHDHLRGHDHEGDEARGTPESLSDPHVWLDPMAMVPVCREVGAQLARVDPLRGEDYARRTAACEDSLRALDAHLARTLAPAHDSPFIAVHNAWGYLCRRYGLVQRDVLREVATREPGPRRLAAMIQAAHQSPVRAVFTEVQLPEGSARSLAGELGVPVVALDPQGTSQDPARDRYFDLLRWNATRIAAGLGGGTMAPEASPISGPEDRAPVGGGR